MKTQGISKTGLVALIVTSSIGAGIFGITNDLASGAAAGPALLAWLITGIGILCLVLSLNNLGEKRPEINSGIFGYADAGFGKIAGFISGWGYWLSAWLGNVAFATFGINALGYFIPAFKGGQNVASVILASVLLWLLTALVNNGIEGATLINTIVTACKLLPLLMFLVIMFVSFKVGIFTQHFWVNVADNMNASSTSFSDTLSQIRSCLLVMMWVFVGIEGATVFSNRAKKRSDAQKASVIGLGVLLVIYVLASILPYGALSQAELAALPQPAMSNILLQVVGSWGATIINVGMIISVLGSWLAWIMLPVETAQLMARDKMLPSSWNRLNKKNVPTYALMVTTVSTNVFLLTFLVTDYAYQFAYSLCTAAILICYLLVALYQIKFSLETKDGKGVLIGVIAAAFQAAGMFLAGPQYLLVCTIAYVPGFALYIMANKEHGVEISSRDKAIMGVLAVVAVAAAIMTATGYLTV